MKKILASAASLALALSFSTAVPTAAMANNGADEAVEGCKVFSDIFDIPLGQCVSFVRQNEKVAGCRLLIEIFNLDIPLGECVSYFARED